MNIHLENIKKLLENINLSDNEKELLLKAVTNADKQWSITDFKLDRTEKVKKTTAILLEETIEELEQKRKAVEAQNKELEIETSLERVRTVALSMNKPDDMLEVCKTIALQLQLLGMQEIRNVQTAIFYYSKGFYMNYEFYAKHDKAIITETIYTNHKVPTAFAEQMLKGKGEVFTRHIKDNEVKDWLAYQKSTNVFIDSYLESANSLSYYWHSLGPVALGISTYNPLTDEELLLFQRFLKVFDLSYRRYLDIEKAIAQSKEAEIELALERVRARTMAMQKSDELAQTAYVLFQQFEQLGENPEQLGIGIFNETENALELWTTINGKLREKLVMVSLDEPIVMRKLYTAWKGDLKTLVIDISGKELQQYNAYRNSLSGIKVESSRLKDRRVINIAYFSKGALTLATSEPRPPETLQLVERFANVFDLTYTRFLDLQKAEAQAREAKIEAALERTRTQSMVMQHSKELDDTLRVFHQQVQLLGINSAFSFLWLPNEEKEQHIFWAIWEEEDNGGIDFKNKAVNYPLDRNEPATVQCLIDWKGNEPVVSYAVPPEGVKNYFAAWQELIDGVEKLAPEHFTNGLYYVEAFMKYGCFGVMLENDLTVDQKKILGRFAIEFERTYTRFLDLQKAEAQAREAQIETGLERVRSRSLAMHNTSELQEVIHTVHKELLHLNIAINGGSFIAINNDVETRLRCWGSGGTADTSEEVKLPLYEKPFCSNLINNIKKGPAFFTEAYTQEEKKDFFTFLFQYEPWSKLDVKQQEETLLSPGGYARSCYVSQHTTIFIVNHFGEKFSAADNDILKRFGKVFEQTYTRFLDLQKAEAQAREATIESALERVRSVAMSMMKSADLGNAVAVVFEELDKLKLGIARCGIGILSKEKRSANVWTTSNTSEGNIVHSSGDESMDIHPLLHNQFEAWLKKESFSYTLEGDDLVEYYKAVGKTNLNLPEQQTTLSKDKLERQFYHASNFTSGGVFAFRDTEFTAEAKSVMKRFANVFDLTYQRFLDLQKAEAQAREAQIETALERVRSRTLAMQKSDELAETASEVFKQLMVLGIEPNRLYIGIVNADTKEMEMWATDEDGIKVGKKFSFFADDNDSVGKLYNGWLHKKKSVVVEMEGEELNNYIAYLQQLQLPVTHALTQKRRVQSVAYFDKGFIGMASPDDQSQDSIQLLERFAAVFNLTFTRFNDLKVAEAHAEQAVLDLIRLQTEKKRAEDALGELRATQTQLIQSEKMASLGELTAGIAHEIQNPLNFVNNFSEVSKELLDEMKEAIEKGDTEEAKEIMNDVIQNLEKINHHGKRADGIVKGMLQHSRSSSGQKELTDINILCDEYLRLAYHGLRAKDKSFNATLKTAYDETLEKINIIPQDIGRVVLNLITNAFYAVGEKKKLIANSQQPLASYEPTVTVSTKKLGAKFLIRVTDNGNGIPQNIIDKIFQPFFTTKPTGQGTGLGLSLAYDIVKAHGGELKVETKAGEGSAFIIELPKI